MSDSSQTDNNTFHLQKYAYFLQENYLAAAAAEYLRIARAANLPLLKVFAAYTEEELQAYCRQSLRNFFSQIQTGTAIAAARENQLLWKRDQLPLISKKALEHVDLTSVFSARKQVFHHFLLDYTQDPRELVVLVKELEGLFTQLEEMAFVDYVEVQQEELQAVNKELRQQVRQRSEVEIALEKDRNYLKTILENMNDGIVACNEQGVLSFFNDATRQMHGLPEESLPAEAWASYYNLYQPDGITPLAKEEVPLYRAFRGELVKDQEIVIVSVKGEKKIALSTGRQIRTSEGKVLGAVVVMREVTNQKKAEQQQLKSNKALTQALQELNLAREELLKTNLHLEQRVQERTDSLSTSQEELRQALERAIELNNKLEESENFLSSIIDQTPVSTWIADANGVQIRVNDACARLFGVEDPSIGIGKYNILNDELNFDKPFYKDIRAVFEEGKIASFDTEYDLSKTSQLKVPDAKPIIARVTIFPIKDAQGRVRNAVIQHEDITRKRRVEMALKESEALFRTIANAAPVGLWMSDEQGHMTFVNQTWIEWTGRAFDEHMGLGWVHSILEEDRPHASEVYQENFVIRNQYSMEFRMKSPEIQVRWCVVEAVPRFKADGSFAGYVGSCIDITERKIAERSLKAKNTELQKINADLDSFIYTASHDLKSPISNVEGLTLLLKKGLEDRLTQGEHKIMELIGVSVARFKRTITDLTDITKIQKNLEGEQAAEVTFKEVLTDVKEDIQEMINSSGAIILEDLAVESIVYPRHGLRSVLYNLLSNAIKYQYTNRQPKITIRTYLEDERVVLRISDNGLGIGKENIHKLFGMFKRLHNHVEGSGIGLYMVKRIVENRGGSIEVSSELNKGTTFTVYLT